MADGPFKRGDIVGLKSGGPIMTVEGVEEYRNSLGWQIQTVWFSDPEFARYTFNSEALEIVEEESE
jgi:uncharacterized protein YodC (DUF2158 family)